MADEFYNFDEALDQLNLKEEELKRLVSEGEIRAFRDGDTMKLRRMDVESLRNELTGGDVVDLGSSGEELIFEDDLDLDEAGMATEEIAMGTEEISDLGSMGMDSGFDVEIEDVGLPEEDEEEPAAAQPVVRRSGPQEEEVQEGMGVRVLAIAGTLVLMASIPVLVALTTGNVGPIAESIMGIFIGAE